MGTRLHNVSTLLKICINLHGNLMNTFDDEDLNIVVDESRFVLLSKDEVCIIDHLIAFKKVDFYPVNFIGEKRFNLNRNFVRMGVENTPYRSHDQT